MIQSLLLLLSPVPVPRYMPETQTAQTTSSSMPPTQAHNETGLLWPWWTRKEGRKRFCELGMSGEVIDVGRSSLLLTDGDEGDRGCDNPSWETLERA